MRDFRRLEVYREAMELVRRVYQLLEQLPAQEKFGLSSQIGRSVVSIPSNIAEGAARSSEKEFKRFIEIALGSSFELETQLRIALDLGFVESNSWESCHSALETLQKRLNAFHTKLKTNS
jgi:four helix bundle protein